MKKKELEDTLDLMLRTIGVHNGTLEELTNRVIAIEKKINNKPHGLVLFPKD